MIIHGKNVRIIEDEDDALSNCKHCAFDEVCPRPQSLICHDIIGRDDIHFELEIIN